MCVCTLYVWMPQYVWTPPVCLHAPMFGHQPYVCITPYVWTPPIYLDAPICLDALLYVWMLCCMFGCPHMCSTAGNTFQLLQCVDAPCMF